jgi:hypothetical protein
MDAASFYGEDDPVDKITYEQYKRGVRDAKKSYNKLDAKKYNNKVTS